MELRLVLDLFWLLCTVVFLCIRLMPFCSKWHNLAYQTGYLSNSMNETFYSAVRVYCRDLIKSGGHHKRVSEEVAFRLTPEGMSQSCPS